jgi:peptidoglycan/LPS O-acetylase OafA/YrhL
VAVAQQAVPQSLSHRNLSGGGSIVLDVLRFGAASTVLFSHFGTPGISLGFPSLTSAGHLAVAVFFVLSGFVIRYVSLTREGSAKQYLIDRAARIYSVVGPALAITVLCEWVAWLFFPGPYAQLGRPFLWRNVPFQIGATLLFQAQNWGYEISPLSNSPFWSLNFECLYYAVYGLIFYRVRGSLLICSLLLLIAGPSIVLVFPVWLVGCLSFDAYRKFSTSRFGIHISSLILGATILTMLLARRQLARFLVVTNDAHRTAWLSRVLLPLPHHQLLYSEGRVPWLANASASYFVIGIPTAIFITWSLLVIDKIPMQFVAPQWFRRVADSTFALYLLHVPVLILIVCMLGKPIQGVVFSTLVLTLTIAGCVGIAIPMDALKRQLRLQMEKSWKAR